MKPPFRTASLAAPPSSTNRIGGDSGAVPSLSDPNVSLVPGTVALRRPPPVGRDAAEREGAQGRSGRSSDPLPNREGSSGRPPSLPHFVKASPRDSHRRAPAQDLPAAGHPNPVCSHSAA